MCIRDRRLVVQCAVGAPYSRLEGKFRGLSSTVQDHNLTREGDHWCFELLGTRHSGVADEYGDGIPEYPEVGSRVCHAGLQLARACHASPSPWTPACRA
eukprot:10735906-Alexandrium_andersonii.AAC.1